jgi:hypothetical protein
MIQQQQESLFRVTLKTWATYQSTVNQQFTDLSSSLTGQKDRLDGLQGLYTNLKYDYTEHIKTFTGHSGLFNDFTGVGGKFHSHTGATSGSPLQDPGHTS